MFMVRLSSEEYGVEYFKYDSEQEALDGFSRLRIQAKEHTQKDGIDREVVYIGVVNSDEY